VWQVARCSSSWILRVTVAAAVAVVVAALALTGCGKPWQAKVEGPFGTGSDQYWVVRSHGKPKAVVALLHGLAPSSGEQLEPWQVHLAAQGDDVIFARYEQPPPAPDARDHAVTGIRAGLAKLGHPDAPLVLLGHSRGGRLAVEAAAFLKPKLVIAVYPGTINIKFEPATNFRKIPRSTNIYLLVGDRDEGVGASGALEMDQRLLAFGFPAARIHGGVIRSTPQFTADHLSVYDLGAPAQKAIWARIDRLIAGVAR
jgi:pimeloyl-ACP methyl ester carboxylesterase